MTMMERFQAKYHGKRYSFGYPACPRLDDQRPLFELLGPEELGVQLTEGFMMDPESSVSALVFHHPQATYFSVGRAARPKEALTMTTAPEHVISQQAVTGIGSLPHHNVDAALEHSLRMGIPFLPQIPIRNPWEFMIAQALEGMPGLRPEPDGSVALNMDIWSSRLTRLSRGSTRPFRAARDEPRFEAFEPSAAVSRAAGSLSSGSSRSARSVWPRSRSRAR